MRISHTLIIMSADGSEVEIEDYATKEFVVTYIETKGESVTPPVVLGRFMMPPTLYDDVELLIDLTY